MNKRILAIHDLSGFGHTSLMAAIPIMYSMGIEVAVLPTVLLSANTDYPDYQSLDTTIFMEKALRHWKKLELSFDAVYSGFLGCPDQVALLQDNLPRLLKPDAITLVDPVLGDDGKLYGCYNEDMVKAMRSLLSISDVITPNFSEAAFLLNELHPERADSALLINWCKRLSNLGPGEVVITSAPNHEGKKSMVIHYNKEQGSYQEFPCAYEPVDFPGAGDCFASLFLAAKLIGYSSEAAIGGCIRFLQAAFRESTTTVKDRRSGIALAKALAGNPRVWFREQ